MVHNKSVIVPAGTYYLGDPCYCFSNHTKTWEKLLSVTDYFREPVAELENGIVLGFQTSYGDGEYKDKEGNSYCVDSGLIGLVSETLIEDEPFDGRTVTFDVPTECRVNDARLIFGDIRIDTDIFEQ